MSHDEIVFDLKRTKKAFAQIDIPIQGLRPPYLSYHKSIYGICADLNFKYVSGSVSYDFPIYENKTNFLKPFPQVGGAIHEIPITVLTDFDLIAYNGKSMKDAIHYWKKNGGADATFLFHSFFIGARKNISMVENFFRYLRSEYKLTTMRQKARTGKGVALSMDIGVLSKMDLLRTFYLK